MSDLSPILSLPLLQAAQAQKHITHNEALMRLDLLVQLAVTNRTLTAPPVPVANARYIVAAGATGAWAGQVGKVAFWQDGVWQFLAPIAGWRAWVAAEEAVASFNGTVWKTAAEGNLTVGQLGVSATPDATNRLSVSSAATLLNHAGAGHQLKLNKAAAGNTASLLFQTGFSGRVEMGTAGDDNFALKTSADGSTFKTALTAKTSGIVGFGQPVELGGQSTDPVAPINGTLWHNSTEGQLKIQLGGVVKRLLPVHSLPNLVPPSGEYVMSTCSAGGTTATTLAGAANRIDIFPFVARSDMAIDRLALNVSTAVASALGRILVYASDEFGRPSDLIFESENLDFSTTGTRLTSVTQTYLSGVTYWLGIHHSSTATVTAWSATATPDINGGTSVSTASRKLLRRTLSFATPAPASWGFSGAEITSGGGTAIWLRMA